jgi:glycosyltransferase involved in cell wall biosynthesis
MADADAFAGEVTRLWRDPESRSRLAESGRRRWLAEFTWDRIAERYEWVYERAAA